MFTYASIPQTNHTRLSNSTSPSVLFKGLFPKSIHTTFDTDLQSSDGGALLLGAIDRKLGLTQKLASCFQDPRQQGKVQHSFLELFRQETFSRALGYADGNDAAILGGDPILQTLCDRNPGPENKLGSQPTLSRFEELPNRHELYQAMLCFEDQIIASLKRKYRKAKRITIDLDGTHDKTHGMQQLSLFNGFYKCHCFLPLLGFFTIDDQPEQWLFHTRLRSGRATQMQGVILLLRRVIPKLKTIFPRTRIRVRLDAGFANPGLYRLLEKLKVEYLIGMRANAILMDKVEEDLDHSVAMAEIEESSHQEFTSFRYRAKSWPYSRRIVAKSEAVVSPGKEIKPNPRFVVTNLYRENADTIYGIYCGRGDSENRIKELKVDLEMDRTSCSKFTANAFRVLQTACAYALFQELRWKLRKTKLARCSVGTLRVRLLKFAVRVVATARKIVMHGPKHWPWLGDWLYAAKLVGAVPV